MNYKNDRQRYRGFLALATLIVIAIIAILYFSMMSSFFNISPQTRSRRQTYKKPWHDEHRILPDDKIIELPEAPKIEYDRSFTLKPAVSREGNPRGTLTLNFLDNGVVNGSWNCSYSHEDRQYTYEATFAGNIDVEVTYTDKDSKEDKSQLYFITKGSYVKGTYNENTRNSQTESGTVYVTGFLQTDYSGSGLLTITTDKEWSADYQWQTNSN